MRLPWITFIVICLVLLAAICAPLLSPFDPYAPDLTQRLKPPSSLHFLGTDTLGRDILTRLLFGARVTLFVVFLTLLIGGAIGIVLGLVAGYFRGIPDALVSRLMDAVFAFPSIFFGLVLAVTLGPGIPSVCISISIVLWARFARIIRDEVISLRERDFIARAKVSGCSRFRILAVHVLPNIVNACVVIFTINIGYVILMEASLSYLGAGIPGPTPSWGGMIAEGQNYIGTAWWISIPPGIAIGLTVLGLSILGDWLRERLDPHMSDL
jgi:peptide/nickel transport system permease protein